MSSSVSATFSLELREQRWQRVLAWLAVLVCGLVPWLLRELPSALQLACSVLGGAASFAGARRVGWLSGPATLTSLVCSGADGWRLRRSDGRESLARLHPETRVFRRFVWLRFDSRHCVLIGPGDLAPEQSRRLQVLLRARCVRERVA